MAELRGGSTVAGLPILGKEGNDNYLSKIVGDKLKDSLIYDDGTTIRLDGNLNVNEKDINSVRTINGSQYAIMSSTDTWLRINNGENAHPSGVYFGKSVIKTDGRIEIGNKGSILNVSSSTFTYRGYTIWHSGNFNVDLTNHDGVIKLNPSKGRLVIPVGKDKYATT